MNQSYDFTKGAILRPLLIFSFPIFGAILLQAMYGAVDLMIMGRFCNAGSVSAVATGSQIMQTINGIVTGMTMGTTVAIGQKIGQKNQMGAAKTVGATVCIFGVIGFLITLLLLIFSTPLAGLLNTPTAALEQTISYVNICAMGTIFTVAYNVISGIMRGLGNSTLPLIFVAIACILNIAGDLLLVGVFAMGATGAAIATVFAQGASAVLSLAIVKKQGLPFRFGFRDIRFNRQEGSQVLKLGMPIAAQDALSNCSFLVITAIINGLGVVYSASIGVGERITFFANLLPMTFLSAMSVVTAQNMGAGKKTRAERALKSAIVVCLGVSLIMSLILTLLGGQLSGIFTNDEAVATGAADYLNAYAIDCPIVAVLFCILGYFNGCGKTFFVMIQGITSAFLVRIPVSYMMSRIPDMTMFQIGLAPPAAAGASLAIALIYFYVGRKRGNLTL